MGLECERFNGFRSRRSGEPLIAFGMLNMALSPPLTKLLFANAGRFIFTA
jgi:hypothetical protein